MQTAKIISNSLPARVNEWCNGCNEFKDVDPFLITRCECGKPVLPCAACGECKVNDTFTYCTRYGLRLEDYEDKLEVYTDVNKLLELTKTVFEDLLSSPEEYIDLYLNLIIIFLRMKGEDIDSVTSFRDIKTCAYQKYMSKIKIQLDSFMEEFPCLGFELLLCFSFWEVVHSEEMYKVSDLLHSLS